MKCVSSGTDILLKLKVAAILIIYARAERRSGLLPILALFATHFAKRFVRLTVHLILPRNAWCAFPRVNTDAFCDRWALLAHFRRTFRKKNICGVDFR